LSRKKGKRMNRDYIIVKGARENNLRNVNLKIPKHKITVFTGVSGSGKSSIVFDTLASEAQRLLYDNFSMFVRNFLPRYSQPDTDGIENLPMAVVIDQKRIGGGSRSTVGTITEIYTLMRMLYSRIGKPYVGYSNSFSFNDPAGACPSCGGSGQTLSAKLDALIDKTKSLAEGAIRFPLFRAGSLYGDSYIYSDVVDASKRISDFSEAELQELFYGQSRKIKLRTPNYELNTSYEGLINKFTKLYIKRDISSLSAKTRRMVADFVSQSVCPDCKGTRLNAKTLRCKINGLSIADSAALETDKLIAFLASITDPVAKPLVHDLTRRLRHVEAIRLGYLSLDRATDTLSGGESQRIKIVKNLGGGLVDVMYIFDEPSIGLHPRDVHRMNDLLRELRDRGNTVLVVEHDPDVIKIADHIIDMGPEAGSKGGTVVFEGRYQELLKSETITGKALKKATAIKAKPRTPLKTTSKMCLLRFLKRF
jgi:excinuclease UvrABC ATPase subunit